MSFVDLNHHLLQHICSHLIQASLTEVRKKIREIQGVMFKYSSKQFPQVSTAEVTEE
jgi:hypothetical protein